MQAGNREKASEYGKRLVALPFVGQENRTLAAWNGLPAGKVDHATLDAMGRDAPPQGMDPENAYLTGLVQIALDKTEEAQRSLMAGLEVDEGSLSDANPRILPARIQERFGLPDAAAASQEKSKSRKRKNDASEWALASPN